MFNRLFDDPPPTLRDMMADARRQSDVPPDQAATIIGAAHDQPVEYSPDSWPHFDQGFAKYERLVGSARSHLFPRCARRMERAEQHRLLVNGLVAPTTAIDSATAGALGWAISWLSPAQVLAPETGFFTPAFGLAAWLARNRGLLRMPVRGLPKVRCVALLYALAHNLMRAVALTPEIFGLGTGTSAIQQSPA